jgi:hypothetical protein
MFKVFEEGKQEAKKEVFFRLEDDNCEEDCKEVFAFTLIACDEYGNKLRHGNIISIKKDGRLFLHKDVNVEIGLSLNNDGEIDLD